MTNTVKLIVGAVAAAILVIGVREYVNGREDRARLEQSLADKDKLIEESRRIQAENQAWKDAQLKEWEKIRATNQTPQQAVKIVHEYAGVTPTIVTPAATAENPTPPPVMQLPLDQAQALANFTITCKECETNLKAANADRAELVRQMQLLEKEKKEAVDAVKGGTLMQRIKRSGKSAGGATAGAAVGAALCGKSSVQAAAICAGVGALGGYVVAQF